MDWGLIKSVTIPEGTVKQIKCGDTVLWKKAVASPYTLIDPIDPVAFPVYTGLKVITLDGSETWKLVGDSVYTSGYKSIIESQGRGSIVGFSEDYVFYPDVTRNLELLSNGFALAGSSSTNGNLSFKDEHTTTTDAWASWLAEHPVTILISVNNPDTSVWKPAIRNADGVTGYWNGADEFVAVHGGIPY